MTDDVFAKEGQPNQEQAAAALPDHALTEAVGGQCPAVSSQRGRPIPPQESIVAGKKPLKNPLKQ